MKEKKYMTLYKSVKQKILSQEYVFGQKLPSKRVMANITGFSIITVENAYHMLADEGYISTREKSGYYVEEIPLSSKPLQAETHQTLCLLEEEKSTDDSDMFEYSVWCKTVRKVLSEKGKELFIKLPPKWCAVLRNAIAQYLLRYRGMFANPSRIVIGSGAESLYEAAIRTLGREKKYGIEDPCYSQIKTVYAGLGVKTLPLKMSNDGIETKCLSKSDIDILHVTPFHSYPSGITASAPKRHEYLRWAKNNCGFIIEDDFDSEFFVPGSPVDSLYNLDETDCVIYINTFSKSLSPSFRMGYMILPERLLCDYDRIMGKYSCTVPVLEQYALAEFISGGSFERHLNRVRRKITQ